MAFKKNVECTCDIQAILGTLKESDKHDWIKGVFRVSWMDNPATIDIRSMNCSTKRLTKGISLSNEEADKLVDILLENDYGSLAELEAAVARKRSIFTVSDSKDMLFNEDDDDYYTITIEK